MTGKLFVQESELLKLYKQWKIKKLLAQLTLEQQRLLH
jgi:hypothetical protein